MTEENRKIDNLKQTLVRAKAYGVLDAIENLEKENAELKEKLKGFENGDVAWQGDMDATIKQNLELKAQIEQLSNDNHVLKTAFITQKEQIEKMKCCGNCINRGLEKYIAYPCSECRRWHRELDSDRWEMEE